MIIERIEDGGERDQILRKKDIYIPFIYHDVMYSLIGRIANSILSMTHDS